MTWTVGIRVAPAWPWATGHTCFPRCQVWILFCKIPSPSPPPFTPTYAHKDVGCLLPVLHVQKSQPVGTLQRKHTPRRSARGNACRTGPAGRPPRRQSVSVWSRTGVLLQFSRNGGSARNEPAFAGLHSAHSGRGRPVRPLYTGFPPGSPSWGFTSLA